MIVVYYEQASRQRSAAQFEFLSSPPCSQFAGTTVQSGSKYRPELSCDSQKYNTVLSCPAEF